MKFTLKTTGFKLDKALSDYVDTKVVKVAEKFLKSDRVLAAAAFDIEIGKISAHHAKGKVWRAEANVSLPRSFLRAEAVAEDMREAIDLLSDELAGEIKKYKGRYITKLKRGARLAKSELKLDPAARPRGGRKGR